MSISVKRLDEGAITAKKSGKFTSCEIQFLVMGATNRASALSAVLESSPKTYEGMSIGDISFGGWDGEGTCRITVKYSSTAYKYQSATEDDEAEEDGDDNEPTLNFDSGSGSAHIVRAITQNRYVPSRGWVADDCAGMIGWNGKFGGDCEFSGVDVPTADMRLTYTKKMRVSKVTSPEYMRVCAECAGKVNSTEFRGWKAGELLFLNASYSASLNGEKWVMVSFNFRASPNEANATIAGYSTGFKPGWDYYWTLDREDVENGVTKRSLAGIYGSQVFARTDFARLGI